MKYKIDTENKWINNPAKENNDCEENELALVMCEIINSVSFMGISSNQFSVPFRAIAIKTDPIFVMINPKIIYQSEQKIKMDEVCISFPKVVLRVPRSNEIRVRFKIPDGGVTTNKFTGMTARVIQHQIDVLDGVTFLQKVNRYSKDKALKRIKRV